MALKPMNNPVTSSDKNARRSKMAPGDPKKRTSTARTQVDKSAQARPARKCTRASKQAGTQKGAADSHRS